MNSIGNGSAAVTKVSSPKVNSSNGGNNNRGSLNKIDDKVNTTCNQSNLINKN